MLTYLPAGTAVSQTAQTTVLCKTAHSRSQKASVVGIGRLYGTLFLGIPA